MNLSGQPSPDSTTTWIAWRLHEVQSSRTFQKYRDRIDRKSLPSTAEGWVLAILLTEMSARPVWFRTLEWTGYIIGRALRFPQRYLPKTRGPFQLADAPYSFDEAVDVVAQRISGIPKTANELARYWNGAASRQPGSRIGYAQVLSIACRVLKHPHLWWCEEINVNDDGVCARDGVSKRASLRRRRRRSDRSWPGDGAEDGPSGPPGGPPGRRRRPA